MSEDHQEPSEESPKLYLPMFCVVPLEARQNSKLTDSSKIYLGELSVLTNLHGYCWASDEDLSKMKGVSIRTIQNWHKELEDNGFIKRETWKEHYKDKNKKGLRIRTNRKIYIIPEPSKNVSDTQNSAPRSDTQNSARINSKSIKEEKLASSDSTNPIPKEEPSIIANRLKALDSLGLNSQTHKRLANGYSYEDILLAVALAHKRSDKITEINKWMTDCLRNRYWEEADKPSKETESKYFELLKTAYKELQERFGIWNMITYDYDEIISYSEGLGNTRAKKRDIRSRDQLIKHTLHLNEVLPQITKNNLGKELKIVMKFVTISGEEKISITD